MCYLVYTGYWARLNDYIRAGLTPIGISGKSPEGYKGLEWKFLAPSLQTYLKWKENHNEFEYMAEYMPKLEKIDKEEFKKKLLAIKNPILLCYEKEGFCHRHLVADWIEWNLFIKVDEFLID